MTSSFLSVPSGMPAVSHRSDHRFALVFAATWMVMNRQQRPLGKPIMWLVATALEGIASLSGVDTHKTGPLLSVSVAWLIVDLAERRSALDKRRTIG